MPYMYIPCAHFRVNVGPEFILSPEPVHSWFWVLHVFANTTSWYPKGSLSLLKYALGCFKGALILMCVPSMTPVVLGNPGTVCASKFCIVSRISSSIV